MTAYRKASIRDLTSQAYKIEGRSTQGVLRQIPEGGWTVGNQPLEEWLARNEGEDVTLILIPNEGSRPMEMETCQTCGREYVGTHCPHCREVRYRLRGR